MKLVADETSLVVAGAWNTAIVTPDWILKFGLQREPGAETRIQAFIPAGAGMFFGFPKFAFDGVVMAVRPDALVFSPKDMDKSCMEGIERLASNTVAALTHTPVSGVGHNFEFRDPDPNPESLGAFTNSQVDLIDAVPPGWGPIGSTLATSLQLGETVVNVTRAFVGGQLSVKFNFHHPVVDVEQVTRVLTGQGGYKTFFDNYGIARELITKMYGEIDDN